MQWKKNQIIPLTITALASDGNGLGRIEGYVVFVPFSAVGDVLEVRLVKLSKNYGYGIIERIITPSPDRISSDCPVFAKCGGCSYRHMTYEAECKAKKQQLDHLLQSVGIEETEPFVGAEQPDCYRNKAQYPVRQDTDGTVRIGFYAKRSHRVVDYTGCKLQPDVFCAIAEVVRSLMPKYGISAYNEETHQGLLKHLYLRRGEAYNEIMLCFVTTQKGHDGIAKLSEALAGQFPHIISFYENINPKDTNVILSDDYRLLLGKPIIPDVLCDLEIELSPHSFYQVNRCQAQKLYTKAQEYCGELEGKTVLDFYCGAGTIGLSVARNACKLVGIEIVPSAVENAKENAKRNKFGNAQFLCMDAVRGVIKLKEEGIVPDVIILDPPRKGCDEEMIRNAAALGADKIVMISCNPATMLRDLKSFGELGYHAVKACGVDMFPRTSHVECVTLMSRVEK